MNLRVCAIVPLGVLLGLATSPALSAVHSLYIENKHHKYSINQQIKQGLSNPYKVLTMAETLKTARQGDDKAHKKSRSPEQRQGIKERRQRFESLPPEEKRRVKEARKKFKQLPPQEREKLKQKWRNLSPEERQKSIQKKRSKHT